MYLYLKCSVKGGTQNTNYKIINQYKNNMCHVQSLEKDFYLDTPGFFYNVFTHQQNCYLLGQTPLKWIFIAKFHTCINQICLVECE
jgi:hypothetical protein